MQQLHHGVNFAAAFKADSSTSMLWQCKIIKAGMGSCLYKKVYETKEIPKNCKRFYVEKPYNASYNGLKQYAEDFKKCVVQLKENDINYEKYINNLIRLEILICEINLRHLNIVSRFVF